MMCCFYGCGLLYNNGTFNKIGDTMSDFPNRFNLSITQETAENLAIASDMRAKSNPYILREIVDDGLSTWLDAQDPTQIKKVRRRIQGTKK